MEAIVYPSFARLYVSISLSVLGAFFNLWALILLLLDYHSPHLKYNQSKIHSKICSTGTNHKVQHTSSRRTTMQVGLIIFCLFEVLYHAASSSGEVINLFAYNAIKKGTIPMPANGSLTYIYSVLPPVSSFFNWIRDTGICGRNWAITLITIARAEVVIWPLASRCYQRCLRQKRFFLLLMSLFALTGIIISGTRRFDQKISVCYSTRLSSYCIFSEVFLLSNFKQFSAVYFSFQTLLPWMLILIFTTLIIFQLKPCKKHSENSIRRLTSKYGGRDNHLRASIAVTVIAVFCTIFEFPTFALSMYYIASDPDEALELWDTIANTLLQIDSIANFFLLIITMPSLRRRLRRSFPIHAQRRELSAPEPRTIVADVEITSKGRD
nr:rhodopsin orphan GPCR [Echinococcus granulosus]